MLGCVCVLAQAQGEKGAFWVIWGSFVPLTYLGIVLDNGVVQSYNLAQLQSGQGGHCMNVFGNLYICPCVCEHMANESYLYETPICFNYIFVTKFTLHGGFFRRVYSSLVKLKLTICSSYGVSLECVFHLFWCVKLFRSFFGNSMLFSGPSFGHKMC